MNIVLNIYGDCESEKPTKTYTIKRILFKTAKEISAIAEESKNKDENELSQVVKYLKAIFPNFKDEDIDGIDPIEFSAFMREVTKAISSTVAGAQKN